MSDLKHWYLHVDLDAFFASVEQLDNPQYRGKPVIVGGLPNEKRSVVSTASYEARVFGVHSAMPTAQAYRLCPQGIFVHGRMKRYAELSYQIMSIFRNYSPDVDQMSIDEAFIDLTGTEKLFGPPQETARRLKSEVREKTGLTVSIGLAPTKYLAKIASGLSKPDGFYVINHGEEENFMLNLPLNKVWGLGSKSLEQLRKKGINSTRDIHNLPYENLEFMFGKNMATFLFEAVRGMEKESFNKKAKSHSISAENTFAEDITDSYTAETQLLEMAQGVMFRLLKEKAISKTVMIKIRYNDFTTFTVQETQDTAVATIDSFYEIAKRLFNNKYLPGKGIRLLGIGFENITNEEGPAQQQLFEDIQKEKKQKVEQAILNMKIKNPDLKIQKARTLKGLLAFILTGSLLQAIPGVGAGAGQGQRAQALFAEESVKNTGAGTTLPDTLDLAEDDEGGSLFEWDLSDSEHVEFSLRGFWRGEVTGGGQLSWTKDSPLVVSGTVPVFKQEVELSLDLMLNKSWYFSADFADSFLTNTLTAGYQGKGFLRSLKLSNRNITIPQSYSADFFGYGISGGQNQAPGLSANFLSANEKHAIDTLIRYDVTSAKSAVFYGMNSITDSKIELKDFARGQTFTFPAEVSQNLLEIQEIYVENIYGSYTDSRGKHYKKVSSSDYQVILNKNTLIFSENAGTASTEESTPGILITFSSSDTVQKIISATGSYSDESTFAGKIQAEFNKAERVYNLEDFSYPLLQTIEGQNALLIQNSYGFSPYLRKNIYKCGLNSEADLSVISKYTEAQSSRFYAEEYEEQSLHSYEDFFSENNLFALVTDSENASSSYPFVELIPEIYLDISYESDLALLVRNYTKQSSLYIGTKAVSGTVQVYKNGNLENASYDQASGNVELSSSVSDTDKIVILWQEEDSDFSNGALVAGIGYQYFISPQLHSDLAFTARLPLSFKDTVATQDTLQQGFAALSAGISYESENIKLSQKASLALQKANASGELLVCQQANTEASTYYHGISDAFEIQSTPLDLDASAEYTIKNFTGLSESSITGYMLPLRWNSTSAPSQKPWAAMDIKLQEGKLLKNSSEVEFALMADCTDSTDSSEYELYIQLGVYAAANKYGEDLDLPTWKIEDFDFSSKSWQTIKISLSDKDRSRLISRHDARIIVVGKGKGCIYAGPYSPIVKSLNTIQDDSIQVSTSCYALSSSEFASRISWIAQDSIKESEESEKKSISAITYFTAADFSLYKKILFKFAIQARKSEELESESSESALSFTLQDEENTALEISISDYSEYITSSTTFHTLEADLINELVLIDGIALPQKSYSFYKDSSVVPSRQKIDICLVSGNTFYSSADFYVGKLLYSENDLNYSAQHYLSAEYNSGDLITINDYKLLKDAQIKLSSLQGFISDDFSIKSDALAGITLAGIRLEADTSAKKLDFYKAGHKIESQEALFSFLTFKENYRMNSQEESLSKEDSASLDFTSLHIPLTLKGQTTASHTLSAEKQDFTSELTTEIPIAEGKLSFITGASASQKINLLKNNQTADIQNNYFSSWLDISSLQFSTGSISASKRETQYTAKLAGLIPLKDLKLSPSAKYSLQALYTSSSDLSFTDTTSLLFQFPFEFSIHKITLAWEKSAEGNFTPESDYTVNYLTDTNRFFELQQERNWFYTQAPFYDFFDKELSAKANSDYSSKYSAEYSRKLFNSTKDLLIPYSLKFDFARNIQKEDTIGDLYQFKTSLANMSLNNFGSNGRLKLFSWFKQDELYSSLSGIVKLPPDLLENTNFQLTWYIQSLLFITDKAFLTTALDLSLDTDGIWLTRGTLVYTRPSKDCLSYELIRLFAPSFTRDKVEILRKNSVNIELGQSESYFHQKYEIIHNAELSFLKYFSLTTGLSFSYTQTQNSANTINTLIFTGTVGAKAEF